MFRHLLRATVAMVVLSASLICSPPARAQGFMGGGAGGGGFLSDPFNSTTFYLPNQQLQSLRPTPDGQHQPGDGRAAILLRRPTAARCTTRFRLTAKRTTILFTPTPGSRVKSASFGRTDSHKTLPTRMARVRRSITVAPATYLPGSAPRPRPERQHVRKGQSRSQSRRS